MKTITELFIQGSHDIIGDQNFIPKGIKIDSRLVEDGDLFFAIHGFESDGHKFIDKAIENGAKAICCDYFPNKLNAAVTYIQVKNTRVSLPIVSAIFYGHPDEQLVKIAVTGTNGKTSTAYFIQSMLRFLDHNCGLIGTVAYDNGKDIVPASHTTPESFRIYQLFSEMIQNECLYVVMEVSSHALSLNRVSSLKYDRAIFTNFSQDHLDFHESMDHYFNAKLKLFENHLDGAAILNADDVRISEIDTEFKFTFGEDEEADMRLIKAKYDLYGSHLTIMYNHNKFNLTTRILGRYNTSNILAAMTTLLSMGFTFKQVVKSVESLSPVPGRMETYRIHDSVVVIDYAHTPEALEKVLQTCRELTDKQIICVFGCGGDRDRKKRPLMAKAAEQFSDQIIVTSDNPRTENPDKIIDDIFTGISNTNRAIRVTDRKAAIMKSIEIARPLDLIVIAGKGHENYQEINKERVHFSDAEIVIELGGQRD